MLQYHMIPIMICSLKLPRMHYPKHMGRALLAIMHGICAAEHGLMRQFRWLQAGMR